LLDPVSALAFEMHTSKGVFALLLGSGISRSAKIPTGWEITLELVSRIAALQGADTNGDPEAWYRQTSGHDPDYSKLLDELATTPSQRQQLLRPFIEPSEAERESGAKRPTEAHQAIARLMARGHVRVVVTTNFDRLLEQALADQGIHATVLSSTDHIAGALPLVHAGPMIVKVHGDYLDTRIRNTTSELAGYEPELDRQLDRIFDEYGLVVCGWSGEWDAALKAAIDRAPSRRFPMYWASRGAPAGAAQSLVDRRGARLIQIEGANEFFEELDRKLQALETLSRPHPLSAELAVAMLKEYLPEPNNRIRLRDLVLAERNRVLAALDAHPFHTGTWSAEIFADQVVRYVAPLGILLPMAYHAGIWSDGQQVRMWVDVVSALVARRQGASGITVLADLTLYPATLVMHAYLLGAVVGERPSEFGALATAVENFGGTLHELTLGDRLNASGLILDGGQSRFKNLPSHKAKKVAASEHIADLLRPIARNELQSEAKFDEAFATVELALAFGYAERIAGDRSGDDFWCPVGRFIYQDEVRTRIVQNWETSFAAQGKASALCMMAGLAEAPRFSQVTRSIGRASALL
jgi:hypothetical protein